MTALIAIASIFAYLGCLVYSARWAYQRIRPSTEPVACDTTSTCSWKGKHYNSCYSQYGMIETTNQAVVFSLLFGLLGPLSFVFLVSGKLLRAAITSGAPQTRAELEAKVARLERELGMDDHS